MKIPTTPSVRRADPSLDVTLNPVELSSKEIVSWGIAFPRRAPGTPQRVSETATIGSVLGTAACSATSPAVTD
jgi:hypothetical protein